MTNSNNLTDKQSQRFQKLVLLTVITIYLLILAGGIVRSTGSGMGCPDWPKCFGRWIPPTEVTQLPFNYQEIYGAKLKGEVEFNAVKTWIEYVNRLLGALSGFFVLATFVASFPYLRTKPSVFWSSLAAVLLTGVNGWLGSRVVASELAQYMISAHLFFAILVVFALLYAMVRSSNTNLAPSFYRQHNRTLSWLLGMTMVLSLAQIMLGAQVREALNEVIKSIGEVRRDSWIDGLDWRFYVHRSSSLVVLALHVGLIFQLRKIKETGTIAKLTTALVLLVVAEIASGAIMAYFAVPAAAQPVHLFLAVLLIGLQFVIWLLLHPTVSSPKREDSVARLQVI